MALRSIKNDNVKFGATEVLKWGDEKAKKHSKDLRILQFHANLKNAIKGAPTHAILLDSASAANKPFFHTGITLLSSDLYVTSRPLASTEPSQLPQILISRVKLNRSDEKSISSVEWWKMRSPPGIAMPAGVASWNDVAVFCAQGNFSPDSAGVFLMRKGLGVEHIITNFYGRQFNSPHGLVLEHEAVWFTDPAFGFEQEFRNAPQMPCQVYMYRPGTKEVRAMADGFGRPTGLAFDGRGITLYVCDAMAASQNEDGGHARAATVYAFDYDRDKGFLTNRRLFAYVRQGVPMDVKCDADDNVYVACGDGVEVYDRHGILLGVIEVPGGAQSFCFGPRKSELIICNDVRLWCVHLKD